jgi:signal transduction histidine kinase
MDAEASRGAGRRSADGSRAVRRWSAIRIRFSSISGKISLLVFGVSAALTAVLSGFYMANDLAQLEAGMIRELSLLAEVMGRNAKAAVAFEDPGAGSRVLDALQAKSSVLHAEIVRADGTRFAAFERDPALASPLSAEGPAAEGRERLLRDGHRMLAERLEVVAPIRLEGREIGRILIVSDLREIGARKRGYFAVGAAIGLGAIALALVLTGLLRRWISRPIENLASLAQRVSEEQRFDLRAARTSADEVGDLVVAFNEMLAQIQRRDADLSVAKGAAEEAAEKLAELLDHSRQTNLRLETEIIEHERAEQALRVKSGELERSNYELNQFAYVASHDLQEPLRMVTMFTQLLQRRYGDQLDADGQGYIDFAVDGAARMRQLIQDLLEYSRTGRMAREFEDVDCKALLDSVTTNLRVSIEESGALVQVGSLPTIQGNPTRLFQLFQNLVSNAIKFRGELPPEIFVEAERQGEAWLFRVRDNGVGIDPAFADRIFLLFQRLHTREEYEGTGIGLALCKRIVNFHGGEIWVESVEGEGSTFLFTLPEEQAPYAEGASEDAGGAGALPRAPYSPIEG